MLWFGSGNNNNNKCDDKNQDRVYCLARAFESQQQEIEMLQGKIAAQDAEIQALKMAFKDLESDLFWYRCP